MADVPVGADAPVVDVAPPAADAVTAPDAPPVQEPAVEAVQPPKTYSEEEVRKVVSDRLKKESRRIERAVKAELERDAALKELEALKAPKTPQAAGKPKASDFADPEAYVEALAEWKFDQKLKTQREESERENQTKAREREDLEDAQIARQKLAAGAKKYADFEEVTGNPDVPITYVMAKAIVESDVSADLAYYLCSHVDEAERISSLPPTRQAIELGRLEDKLKAPPKPTQTPPPIKPLDGNAGAKRDWADLSTAEHVEKWLKRKR
jgi:signal recognition particle GTPase